MYFILPGRHQHGSHRTQPYAFDLARQLPPAVRQPTSVPAHWWVSRRIADDACSLQMAVHQPGPLKCLPGTPHGCMLAFHPYTTLKFAGFPTRSLLAAVGTQATRRHFSPATSRFLQPFRLIHAHTHFALCLSFM